MAVLNKILIADDSSSVRKILCHAIKQIDPTIEIIEASDGVEAVKALASRTIDMAFLDVHMPGISGLDALKLARKHGINTFVVMISGQFEPDLVNKAKEFHAYDYLKKPFEAEEIQRLLSVRQQIARHKSLLVVDDSKIVRRVVFKVLKESQFNLKSSEANSGEQAIQLCRTIPYDIIFIDYHMPGFDGLTGAREIFKTLPNAKIVLMSSDDNPQIIKKAQEAGLCGFMKKPFYPDDVDMVLHEIMGLTPPSFGKKAILFPQESPCEPEQAANDIEAEDEDAILI